jgi:hypothetical protein
MAFAFLGVMIAQLFRLQSRGSDSGPALGFDDLGVPLACSCYGCAIIIALLGAHRFWRQQSAMARGKVYAGGWELNTIGVIGAAVSALLPEQANPYLNENETLCVPSSFPSPRRHNLKNPLMTGGSCLSLCSSLMMIYRFLLSFSPSLLL